MYLALFMQSGQNSPLPTLLLFGGMAALFYFLLIRPQNKARKAMEEWFESGVGFREEGFGHIRLGNEKRLWSFAKDRKRSIHYRY